MQFLVYLTVLMVSVSTVLLELHWLTSPAPQPKSAVHASAPPPKVEGPSAALSPVYPRKAEAIEPAANVQQPPPAQPQQQAVNQPQPQPQQAPAIQAQAQQPQTKPQLETTGMATREDPTPAPPVGPPAPARAGVQQASVAPLEAMASSNRCDVQACAGAYRSFRASDCTYQPFDGGERRLCAKGATTARSAARDLNSDPAAVRRSVRDFESRDRETDRRARAQRDDDDDDAVAADDGERGGPLLFLFGGQRRRW